MTGNIGQVTFKIGAILDYEDVHSFVRGCDEADTIRSQTIVNIVNAMRANGVRRIIAVGRSGVSKVGSWRFNQLPIAITTIANFSKSLI